MGTKIDIPAPLIVVVEDVGWWSGVDGSDANQPFRSGMKRNHLPDDYRALTRFGKELGIQIIAGFVWCEWDRLNRLKSIPTATWMGKNWDNPFITNPHFEEVVDIINTSLSHIEIAFHGIGHEFWEDGIGLRTEFHDTTGEMRDISLIRQHMNAFQGIYTNSGIIADLPELFIPPALKHSFGNGINGFQKILDEFGFKAVITSFAKAKQFSPPIFENFSKECDVTLIERGISPVQWNDISAEPSFSFKWPVLSLHWSNLLHNDPAENMRAVRKWIEFLLEGVRKHEMILVPNAKDSIVQLIYSELAEIEIANDLITIDLSDANSVLPDFSEVDLHLKLNGHIGKPLKINGGRILSTNRLTDTDHLINIRPQKNRIRLTIR